jgi:putative restriction endonuclease
MERDEDVRTSCFSRLAVLQAHHGDELQYAGVLSEGFPFRGRRVPFLNYQKASRPGLFRPLYPYFVTQDFLPERRVLVSPGKLVGPLDEPDPVPVIDPIEREYVVRETKVRLHQGRFRGAVLLAYRDQCTICRLKEIRLLDAAHIEPDTSPAGDPLVRNGLSMCTIHHRAFDQNLVGITSDYEVRVSHRLLDDEDGPMLDVLKGFHGRPIQLPARHVHYPNRERLAARFERFE